MKFGDLRFKLKCDEWRNRLKNNWFISDGNEPLKAEAHDIQLNLGMCFMNHHSLQGLPSLSQSDKDPIPAEVSGTDAWPTKIRVLLLVGLNVTVVQLECFNRL